MAAVTTQATNPPDNPLADFGPNEWLVEDMYQRYLADPASVDPAWHDFFADYKPGGDGASARPAAAPAEPHRPGTAPAAKPAAAPTRASRTRRGRRRPRPRPHRREAGTVAAAPVAPEPQAGQGGRPRSRPRRRPARTPPPLRGVAARIVANMDASLTVPTATSVRAVPAKLIADNRIVINNHLARGPRRQGQLHAPHRLRDGPGAGQPPGDEQLVRRGRRQAGHWSRPSTSTSASRSTWSRATAPAPWSCRASRTPRRWTSGSSGRPTRTSSAGPAATS